MLRSLCISLIVASAVTGSGPAQAQQLSSLERFTPARSSSLIQKWTALQPRLSADARQLAACRADPEACSRESRWLHDAIEAARAQDGRARVAHLNRAVNLAIRPLPDEGQFGAADYWASPLETLRAGGGDCEDYAILKVMALRELGFAPEHLRLMILRAPGRPADHAVAAVRLDGTWLILDNRGFALSRPAQTRSLVLAELAFDTARVETAASREPAAEHGFM